MKNIRTEGLNIAEQASAVRWQYSQSGTLPRPLSGPMPSCEATTPTALRPSGPAQQWIFHQAEKGIDISDGRAIWLGHRKGRLKFLFIPGRRQSTRILRAVKADYRPQRPDNFSVNIRTSALHRQRYR